MATFNGDNRIFPLELIFVTFAHTAHSKKSFFFLLPYFTNSGPF